MKEIIVVCDTSYQDIFEDAKEHILVDLKFALPGNGRQDSVYSGLEAIDPNSELVCIHDSARPPVSAGDVTKFFHQDPRAYSTENIEEIRDSWAKYFLELEQDDATEDGMDID